MFTISTRHKLRSSTAWTATIIILSSALIGNDALAATCLDDTDGTGVPEGSQLCDLGTLPNGGGSFANSLNSDASIIVGWAFNEDGVRTPVYWDADGNIHTLSTLNSLQASQAQDVSSDGKMIVGNSDGHAVVWENGSITDLGLGRVDGISNDGKVFVGKLGLEAYRWANGVGMGLGFLSGTSNSIAWNVSADGSVVVGASGNYAMRWNESQGMISLGLFPGGTYSVANSVSDDGYFIAGYGDNSSGADRSFRWDADVGLTDIGALFEDSPATYAYGINADGTVIVGESYDPEWYGRAFRWIDGQGMENLGTLTGGTYSAAFGVSPDGNTVVGWGDVDNWSTYRAFIWHGVMQDLENLTASFPVLAGQTSAAAYGQQSAFGNLFDQSDLASKEGQSFMSIFGGGLNSGNPGTAGDQTSGFGGFTFGHGVSDQLTVGLTMGAIGGNHAGSAVELDNGFATAAWGLYSEGGSARSGLQAGISLGRVTQDASLTRGLGLSDVELALGNSDLTTEAARIELGYGFITESGTLVTPRMSILHSNTTRGAYAEDEELTAFSAAYDEMSAETTVADFGVVGDFAVNEMATVSLGAGLEFDMSANAPHMTGTSNIPGLEEFDIAAPLSRNKSRPYVTAGYRMNLGASGGVINADIEARRSVYGDDLALGASVSYGMSF